MVKLGTYPMQSLRERAEAIIRAAGKQPPEGRSAFIEKECHGDQELQAAVQQLLNSRGPKTDRFAAAANHHTAHEPNTLGFSNSGATSLSRGDEVGPYHIVEPLGAGGMGEVYKALDPRLNRNIALKILSNQALAVGLRSRFLQEARAAASLSHPNIAHVYEIAEVGGTCYIAMEFIDGETLRQKMKAGVPLPEMIRYLRDAASALARAHSRGIVHCDLKPDNIMVTTDGVVKVLDFGLAKLIFSYQLDETDAPRPSLPVDAPGNSAGFVEGTLGYMSPEQAAGEPIIDQRSDIFSFGCLLFEVATRKLPFASETTEQTMHRIASEPTPRISGLCEGAPPALQQIIDRCLEKDPGKRIANMDEVAHSLDAILTGAAESRSGDKEFASTGTGTFSATRKKLWIAAAIVFATASAVTLSYLRWLAPTSSSSVAVLPFAFAQGGQELEFLADGISEDLISDLSQLPELKVISRGSSFRFKGKDEDVRGVAKSLGAGLIITGHVSQTGDRYHLSVELVNGSDGTQAWGAQYDPARADLPMVQGKIAKDLGERIRLKLTQSEQNRLAKSSGPDPEAYELLLRGRYQMRLYTAESRKKAIDFYQEAIELDPNYALAHAELAYAYRLLSGGAVLSPGDTMPKAEAAARRALTADPDLAEGHTALADVLKDQWRWQDAGREYQRAIELSPNYVLAHIGYAIYLSLMGQSDEAVSQIARARELDPLGLPTAIDAAAVYYNTRHFDQARDMLRRATELDPAAPSLWLWTGIVNGGSGRVKEALPAYEKAIGWGDNTAATMCFYGYALARAGRQEEALRILHQVEKSTDFVPPSAIAVTYVGLGDNERAMQLLQRAFEIRDPIIQYIKVESHYDPLKNDPRFQELIQKLGLPR